MTKTKSPETKEDKESGASLSHKEESQVEKREEIKEEEKERFVIQINRTSEEEGYTVIKKEGKIWITQKLDKAKEACEKLIAKHPEIAMSRVCRVSGNTLIPVYELTGKDVVIKNKTALPEEMRGVIQPDMLDYMDEGEINSIRALIAEYLRKKQEIEQFSRLAVQRSSFKRNKDNMKRLEEIKREYEAAKKTYEEAKEIWDKAREEAEQFIEEAEKKYPSIGRWLRVEITGTGRTIRRTSGRQRITGGKREVILRFLRDNKGARFTEKEIRQRLKEINSDYSWSQQSTWAPLKSLREEGIIAQDEEGKYYLP